MAKKELTAFTDEELVFLRDTIGKNMTVSSMLGRSIYDKAGNEIAARIERIQKAAEGKKKE